MGASGAAGSGRCWLACGACTFTRSCAWSAVASRGSTPGRGPGLLEVVLVLAALVVCISWRRRHGAPRAEAAAAAEGVMAVARLSAAPCLLMVRSIGACLYNHV